MNLIRRLKALQAHYLLYLHQKNKYLNEAEGVQQKEEKTWTSR
nr:hypothetical protein [Providencia alcalifaciens]